MPQPRRQHYLPKFYLNNFTNKEGYFYIFDEEKSEIRKQTPINTALEKDLYTIDQVDGNDSYFLEKIFSMYESEAKAIFDKIKEHKELNDEEKYIMSFFVALLQTRTPYAIESMADLLKNMAEKSTQRIMQIPAFKNRFNEKLKKGGLKEFTDEEYETIRENTHIKINPKYALSMSIAKTERLALIYHQQNWLFLCINNQNRYFITTDNPFMLYKDDPDIPLGVGIKGVQKVCPITNKVLLIILDKGSSIKYISIADKKQIRDLNMFLFLGRKRYVIAGEKELLQFLYSRCGDKKILITSKVM